MANYINLTLDTLAPQGVSIVINDGAASTNVNAVNYTITCSDEDLTGYQMKVWGTAACPTEDDARWISFRDSDTSLIPSGDGPKTLYVKVRDDVWNESATASATINLITSVPTVSVSGPTLARISNNEGKDVTTFTFTTDASITACKVMLVENTNVKHDDATNRILPSTNGSGITVDIGGEITEISYEGLQFDVSAAGLVSFGGKEFTVTLNSLDLCSISPSDGVKTIKVFVKEKDGNWSV